MKAQTIRNINAMSLLAIIISSFFVFAGGSAVQGAAANPDDVSAASGSNRFVVWSDSTPGNEETFFRRSMDNGATWQATKNLSNNPGHTLFPDIAVSGSNVFVVWLQTNADNSLQDIFFRRSTDDGATWKPIIKITASGTVGYARTPQVIASGSNVYVVWDQFDGEVYFRRSSDNGATWKSLVNISSNPGRSNSEGIGVSGSNIFIIWLQANAEDTSHDIFFKRSTDNGATWRATINLSNYGRVANAPPDLAVSGANVHVTWNEDLSLDRSGQEIAFRSSNDNGASWAPKLNLSNTPDEDSVLPQISTAGSSVHIVWEEIIDESDKIYWVDVMVVSSTDNGLNWESPLDLGDSTTDYSFEKQIAASGSNVHVAWLEGDLTVRSSNDNGASWGSSKLLTSGRIPNGLQIAVTGSSVYLAWDKQVGFQSDVFFTRSLNNGDSWKFVKNLSNNSGGSGSPQIGV